MNLRQLRTLAAFLEHSSFSAVGKSVLLSHSAISVQMQQLESELETSLFDRRSRPPRLTDSGKQIATLAVEVNNLIDTIRTVAAGHTVAGTISIGFVPTTLRTVLPKVLNQLRAQYPQLRVSVKSGLSGELAAMVIQRQIDYALLTSPIVEMPELSITEIALEPLYVIAPLSQAGVANDAELARSMPFVAFNKKTWLGRQIATRLQSRRIVVDEMMEVDSLDVIEELVADGFGVSIVPQRLETRRLSEDLLRIPFCQPTESRKLVLVQHVQARYTGFENAILEIFTKLNSDSPRQARQ